MFGSTIEIDWNELKDKHILIIKCDISDTYLYAALTVLCAYNNDDVITTAPVQTEDEDGMIIVAFKSVDGMRKFIDKFLKKTYPYISRLVEIACVADIFDIVLEDMEGDDTITMERFPNLRVGLKGIHSGELDKFDKYFTETLKEMVYFHTGEIYEFVRDGDGWIGPGDFYGLPHIIMLSATLLSLKGIKQCRLSYSEDFDIEPVESEEPTVNSIQYALEYMDFVEALTLYESISYMLGKVESDVFGKE